MGWNRVLENAARIRADFLRVRADFLRVEVETGTVFAHLALSARNEATRSHNTKNAKKAYITIIRLTRGDQSEIQAIAGPFQRLNRMLVTLGDMSADVLGRRLDDRIRKLAAIAQSLPSDSPVCQKITEQIKAEISDYFEREKNPPYVADRRSQSSESLRI